MGGQIERMYDHSSARLSDFAPPHDRKFEVYLYRTRQQYLDLVGAGLMNTGGIFMPSRNLLAAFLEGQGRDSLRRTLQHEAFHQFALTTIGPRLPVWLNEGLAQVFEEGLWVGNEFHLEQVPPRRLRQLQQDMRDRRLMPFRQFLVISDADWNKDLRNATIGAARYNQAWAMTHFLVFAADENNPDVPRYRTRLTQMLKLIHNGEKAGDAFVHAFSSNIDGFQDNFIEYARALQPTQDATIIEHQGILADLLILLGKEGKRFDSVESFRDALVHGGYRLNYAKGNVHWSTESDPTVYFRDVQGRLMTHEQFYFSTRAAAPLPDMVCCPEQGKQFRTIFHDGPSRPDHETIIEGR
jgi:hypothetical protein